MALAKTTGATLTLLRGRNYTLVHPFDRRLGSYQFIKGTPREVRDPDVVEYARSLVETVYDGDGAEIQKPMFRIAPIEPAAGSSARMSSRNISDDTDSEQTRKTSIAGTTPRRRR